MHLALLPWGDAAGRGGRKKMKATPTPPDNPANETLTEHVDALRKQIADLEVRVERIAGLEVRVERIADLEVRVERIDKRLDKVSTTAEVDMENRLSKVDSTSRRERVKRMLIEIARWFIEIARWFVVLLGW